MTIEIDIKIRMPFEDLPKIRKQYLSILQAIKSCVGSFPIGEPAHSYPACMTAFDFDVERHNLPKILDAMKSESLIIRYLFNVSDPCEEVTTYEGLLAQDLGIAGKMWDVVVWVQDNFEEAVSDILDAAAKDALTEQANMQGGKTGRKQDVVISRDAGIYFEDNKKMAYPIKHGSSRGHIVRILQAFPGINLGGIQSNLPKEQKFKGNAREAENSVYQAIGKINKLFKGKTRAKHDLIVSIPTGGYKLNDEEYEFVLSS